MRATDVRYFVTRSKSVLAFGTLVFLFFRFLERCNVSSVDLAFEALFKSSYRVPKRATQPRQPRRSKDKENDPDDEKDVPKTEIHFAMPPNGFTPNRFALNRFTIDTSILHTNSFDPNQKVYRVSV